MTLTDRFICRREGHKPAVKITNTSGVQLRSQITTCVRCGRTYEVAYDSIKISAGSEVDGDGWSWPTDRSWKKADNGI